MCVKWFIPQVYFNEADSKYNQQSQNKTRPLGMTDTYIRMYMQQNYVTPNKQLTWVH